MDLIQRAKNICLTPTTEWPVIATEPATPGGLLGGYAAPLAAIGAIAGFIGGTNEFGVVVGDRFVVSAKGRGVDLAALKAAVTGLDLSKLEGMKDVG
jgi:hypothetical protein